MQVLLIYPPSESVYGSPVYPPLGLAYLSAILNKEGLSHTLLDLELYPNWRKKLSKELNKKSYDIVGISSRTYGYDKVIDITKIVKSLNPDTKIVLGGPHPSIMGEKILRDTPYIDFIIRGEGEHALIGLINAINGSVNMDVVPNLCYKSDNEIRCNRVEFVDNLDEFPYPEFRKFELLKYTEAPKKLPVLTSRGCPYSCIYCSVGMIMGKRCRFHSKLYLLNEIKYLHEKYKTTFFDFLDDNFTLNITRAKEICKLLLEEKIDISWALPNGIRADRVDKELIALMKKAGCKEVAIGIESGKDFILRNLKRGVTIDQIQKCVELLKEYRIRVKGFFLIGSPGERIDDVLYSLKIAKKLNLDEIRFGMLTPYPGTELWNWIEENGLWVVERPFDEIVNYTHIGNIKSLYQTPEFSADEKEKAYMHIWREIESMESKKLKCAGHIKRFLSKSNLVVKSYHKLKYILKVVKYSAT